MKTASSVSPIKTVNPYTNEVVKEFTPLSRPEAERIIVRADQAFQSWRKTPFTQRAAMLHKVAAILRERQQELAKLATLEMGKLLAEAVAEVALSADIFDYYATHGAEFLADEKLATPQGEAFISYEPIGVLLSVQPWNFPFYQITRSAAPNLMAGNTMVLKHASNVPQCAEVMEQIFLAAGAPEGVYNNLFVPGNEVDVLVAHPLVKGVTLTGSEPAGASLSTAAGKVVKKATLELGGSDPFVVLDDADIDAAVEMAVNGRLWNAGQVCVSPKRVIVPEKLKDVFLLKSKSKLAQVKVGDPLDPATQLAPLSTEKAAQDVVRQVEKAITQGARLVLGGHRLSRPGAFVEPTILTDITPKMDVYHEEVFGPVLMIYGYKSEEEAIRLANATRFGLGGTVFAKDTQRAVAVARQIETGMVYINHVTGIAPELPFGGTKSSGYGREQSRAGIYEFVNPKLIRVTTAQAAY